jgi:hypothetical protein
MNTENLFVELCLPPMLAARLSIGCDETRTVLDRRAAEDDVEKAQALSNKCASGSHELRERIRRKAQAKTSQKRADK